MSINNRCKFEQYNIWECMVGDTLIETLKTIYYGFKHYLIK